MDARTITVNATTATPPNNPPAPNGVNPDGSFKVNNLHAGEARMDVSRNWFRRDPDQKFLNLNDLHASVKRRRDTSTERTLPNHALSVIPHPNPETKDDLNSLWVGIPNEEERGFTHHSFNQLASLAKAPASYLRTLPGPIAADALEYGLRYNRSVEEVKTYYTLGDAGSLRAITGPRYGRIYDEEVVTAVKSIAGDGTGSHRWKVPGVMDWRTMRYDPNHPVTPATTTLYASDRDVFIFLVDDRNPIEVGKTASGDPDLMFRGFMIQNSEVGTASLKVAAFYLRAICCNRILWGVENFHEVSIRHTSGAPDRFIREVEPALESFASGDARTLVEGVEKAKAAKIARDDEQELEWIAKRGHSRKRAKELMETSRKEENRGIRTAWDYANAVTAFARTIPNNDDRVHLEAEAQKVLDRVA